MKIRPALIIIPLLIFLLLFPLKTQALDYNDKSLSVDNLKVKLDSEALPNRYGVRYAYENIWYKLQRFFTFNKEKKTELDVNRLHQLDRKLSACASLANVLCMAKVDVQIEKTDLIARAILINENNFNSWREKNRKYLLDKIEIALEIYRDVDEATKIWEEFNYRIPRDPVEAKEYYYEKDEDEIEELRNEIKRNLNINEEELEKYLELLFYEYD